MCKNVVGGGFPMYRGYIPLSSGQVAAIKLASAYAIDAYVHVRVLAFTVLACLGDYGTYRQGRAITRASTVLE